MTLRLSSSGALNSCGQNVLDRLIQDPSLSMTRKKNCVSVCLCVRVDMMGHDGHGALTLNTPMGHAS